VDHVLRKRDNFRKPSTASSGEDRALRREEDPAMMSDAGIVRNRAKIEARSAVRGRT